ncbi:MAG: SEC-C domain-containing protein [Candidatus Caenarcaniphilales bacterium]|nr:SEC-C domain-containing protein [Candidatus Caenarcaniphilales bacterium]
MSEECPCGSGKNYRECCKLYHDGFMKAATAELLMRSRYSAYVMKKRDYLLKTWDEESCPKFFKFDKNISWLSLEIIGTELGTEFDDEGWVEFKAHFKTAKKKTSQHEKSHFVKINSQWIYNQKQSVNFI